MSMKRQAKYHQKRSETHTRVTLWLETETTLRDLDAIRDETPRATLLTEIVERAIARRKGKMQDE